LISFGTLDDGALIALGMWCEARPPLLVDRANVSYVEQRGPDLFVRTFERGVGLTNACGSAMAAATYAAALTDRIAWDTAITVFNPGGRVRAAASRSGWVTIEGNATFEWAGEIELDLAAGKAIAPVMTDRRDEEVAAWARVIA
jgi:diaminopimelate epimerase